MEEVALARGSRRSSEFEACAYVIGGGPPVVEEVALRRPWRVVYSKKLGVFGGSWQAREEDKKAE